VNRRFGSTISILAVALYALSATAREEPAGGRALEEIIVTAQKREESLQNAAISVTAVGGDALVRAQVTDTNQLTMVAPSLQVGTIAGSANTFYIRGVGNFTSNSNNDAAVSFNVDGVPYARSQGAHGVFYDLERIEVLKGPQGTLYGRNATGGAINVITAKPRPGELGGYGTVDVGNYDLRKFTGVVNLPVGRDGAVRLAGQVTDRDGYYSDGTGDEESYGLRLQYRGVVSDGIELTVGADYADEGGVGPGSTFTNFDKDDYVGMFDPRSDAVFSNTFVFLAGNTLQPVPRDAFNDNQFWGIYAQADIDTPLGTLTVLPAYRKTEISQRSYGPSFSVNPELDSDQTSIEVRLASDDAGRFSYLLGGFYLHEDSVEVASYNQAYFNGGGTFANEVDSFAAFGTLTFHVTEQWRLTAGARYTVDDKSTLIESPGVVVICPPPGSLCPGTPQIPNDFYPDGIYAPDGSVIPVRPWGPSGAILTADVGVNDEAKTFKKTTVRGAIEYDITPDSLLYASVETGFKAGGFFATIDDPVYDPETITAFTIGSKNRFFDNTLQLNVEAFHWAYKEQQVAHLSANSLGGVEFITENVGKSRLMGVEIDGLTRVGRGTTLRAMVQYLDATNKEFTYTHPIAAGFPTTACPVSGPSGGLLTVDCGGRTPPNAPKWTLAGGIEQIIPVGGSELLLNVDARYQSGMYTGFEELPAQWQKDYAMVNAQLSYVLPGSGFTVTLYGNNITDTNVAGFSIPNPRAGGTLVVQSLRPPRTYGVRLNYTY